MSRRTSKTSNGSTDNWRYDGNEIIEDNNSRVYVHGRSIDERLGFFESGGVSYYLADALGSVRKVVDSTGSESQSYTYKDFGKIKSSSGTVINRYAYTAREYDSETGLYYYRARYYDPKAGRFITKDPIGFGGGINVYSYTHDNPLRWIDPFGNDIYYIRNRSAVGEFGHVAVVMGNEYTGYDYYSYNMNSPFTKWDNMDYRHFRTFKEMEEYLAKSKKPCKKDSNTSSRYDDYMMFRTTVDQDQNARRYFQRHGFDSYNLFTKNCDQVSTGSMRAGDVNIGTGWFWPNGSWKVAANQSGPDEVRYDW